MVAYSSLVLGSGSFDQQKGKKMSVYPVGNKTHPGPREPFFSSRLPQLGSTKYAQIRFLQAIIGQLIISEKSPVLQKK